MRLGPTTGRLAVLLVGVVASLASTLDPSSTPEVDDCADPTTTGATSLEIGASDEDQFRPLVDGDVASIIVGGQGTDMVPLRFRVSGLPAGCVSHETRIETCPVDSACLEDDLERLATSVTPLSTYDDASGVATRAHFVILDDRVDPGQPLFVSVRVAGVVSTVQLWADQSGMFVDAGVDAGEVDAGSADAGSADAAVAP